MCFPLESIGRPRCARRRDLPGFRRRTAAALLFLLLPLAILSCAFGPRGRIDRALDEGRWEDAIPVLEAEVYRSPGDGVLRRDLGRAFLETGRYEEAVEHLRAARDFLPEDRAVPLLLGLAQEGRREWNRAIAAYRSYPGSAGGSVVARSVRGRIARLVREIYGERARKALDEPEEPSGDVIAVRYFDVLAETEIYGNLGKGLAEQLIADLSRLEGLHVLPRLFYESFRREANAAGGRSAGTDRSPEMTLGAGWSLGGTILPREERDEVRIEFFLVDNLTGDVHAPTSLSGRLSEFFDMERRIVSAVMEMLDLPPPRETDPEWMNVPTTNFKAFLAYCNALEAEDRENHDRARSLFGQALRLDPGFALAEERLERVAGDRETIAAIAAAELERPREEARTRRLDRTAAMLGPAPPVGFGEENDLSVMRPSSGAELTVRVDRP
ncbi:MAG: tetratricopeptide repeat protein [Candidatus Eisenbacteria bacterium]|nr:tetratricopeptide repeat protein [Candidatus Eisenbacteria bacterium]